jgi:tetratricopeptide (TPR) repeat protein
VAAAWEESLSSQRQGKLPEALSAARRATGLAAGGEADQALRGRADARVADLELVEKLEDVSLQWASAVTGDHFDEDLADTLYQDVFQKAGLDVEAGAVREVGERIRATSVAAEVAAALDTWALVRLLQQGPHDGVRKKLLQVARAADPDPWRLQLREALEQNNRAMLLQLASSEEAFRLLPATQHALEVTLRREKEAGRALALLREARRRHPGDFWANEELGFMLNASEPPDPDGAVRFYAAAVAIRPTSAGAHNNLGNALKAKGRLNEAIAEYREAITLSPNDAYVYTRLGNALAAKGDLDGAIAAFQTAIANRLYRN